MLRLAALALAFALPAAAQPAQTDPGSSLTDRVVTWRTYSATREARVRTFASGDERRPVTVVVDDRASNGSPVTDDAGFVADYIGRETGIDPTTAAFVFRFTPAAFADDARDAGKTLLLRATFSRLASGALGSPQWRVVTADALDEMTDRAFR